MKINPALCIPALLLAGCGGAGSPSQATSTGSLAFRIAWPEKSAGRVIPSAAQSILVRVLKGATVVSDTILTRSAPQTTVTDLPTGTLTVKATAYPAADATGTPMAQAETTQAVTLGTTPTVDLTMASTIDHLAITPNPVTLSLTGLFQRQIAVTAYDASNAVVLLGPTDITFSTPNNLLLSVNALGLVVGLSVGNGTVMATDVTSGKSVTAPVAITL